MIGLGRIIRTWLARRNELERLASDNGQLIKALQLAVNSSVILHTYATVRTTKDTDSDLPPAWVEKANENLIEARAVLHRYSGAGL